MYNTTKMLIKNVKNIMLLCDIYFTPDCCMKVYSKEVWSTNPRWWSSRFLRWFLTNIAQFLTRRSLSTRCNTGTILTCPVSAEAVFPVNLSKHHGDRPALGSKGKPSGKINKVILKKKETLEFPRENLFLFCNKLQIKRLQKNNGEHPQVSGPFLSFQTQLHRKFCLKTDLKKKWLCLQEGK